MSRMSNRRRINSQSVQLSGFITVHALRLNSETAWSGASVKRTWEHLVASSYIYMSSFSTWLPLIHSKSVCRHSVVVCAKLL